MLPRRQSAAFRIIEIMGNYILQSPDLFVMLAATPPRKLSLMAALATRLLRTSDAPYGMIELLNDRVTPQRVRSAIYKISPNHRLVSRNLTHNKSDGVPLRRIRSRPRQKKMFKFVCRAVSS
jgi:hypothetical protein